MLTQRKHISTKLDHELEGLREQLLAMGNLVDAQVSAAIKAFIERDPQQARRVIDSDGAVNDLERKIDEHCISVLALWQPEASDLRFVAAVLKSVTDLERIGDLAVSTAEQVDGVDPRTLQLAGDELSRLVDVALDMLRRALQAFVDSDVKRAESVIARDATAEQAMERLVVELRGVMCRDAAQVPAGLATISVAKHVERMAAHATNIAEMVIYIARGEDVRHPK